MRLIFFPQTDDLPVSAATTPPDNDSGAWWVGVQQCMVAVPLAGALAAVALSASLAFGYQPEAEELPTAPVAVVHEDTGWWPIAPAFEPPPPVVFWADDELVPLAGVAEDAWAPPAPAPQLPSLHVWTVDDELVPLAGIVEDGWNPPPAPPPPLVLSVWTATDEVVPQGAAVEDEGSWQVPVFLEETHLGFVWVRSEAGQPAPSILVADAEVWSSPLPPPPLPWTAVWAVGDELAAQPSFTPSDEYDALRPAPSPLPVVSLFQTDDDAPAGFLFPASENDPWLPIFHRPAPSVPWVGLADEAMVPQAPAGPTEEDAWLWPVFQTAQRPLVSATVPWGATADDEIPTAVTPPAALTLMYQRHRWRRRHPGRS